MATTTNDERTAGDAIRALEVGKFTTLKKIDQGGALQARRLSSGSVQFYWRYTHEGKTDRVAIGTYDSTASPKSLTPTSKGYSVAAAAEACRAMATIQAEKALVGGFREHEATVKREYQTAKAKVAEDEKHTLAKLLDAYVEHLKKSGRSSNADANSIFRLHVAEAWPEIANGPASKLTPAQFTDMLRRLAEDGKGRTANKLRAYVRAAYQCALDVDSLMSIPKVFRAFHITTNPAALTKRDAKHDKADKNPLRLPDLRAYWQAIKKEPGIKGAALRLHLLSGGQRIEQLVNMKNAKVTATAFTIFDAKGRPGHPPREHTVPLVPAAAKAMKELKNAKEYALSTDGGEKPLSAMTLTNWAREIPHGIEGFQLKRIRSGVETALAAARVSKEIRGHLQSHGLTGVQARHYDAHEYEDEKREALQILFKLLDSEKLPASKSTPASVSERKTKRTVAG
jgi:integrase